MEQQWGCSGRPGTVTRLSDPKFDIALTIRQAFISVNCLHVQVAELRHEADNPRDKNALLLVAGPPGGVLGYLPRLLAHHLGPLVRQGLLGSKASVLKLSTNDKAPINVDLEVSLCAKSCGFDKACWLVALMTEAPPLLGPCLMRSHRQSGGHCVLQLWPKLADGDTQMAEVQQKLLQAQAVAESAGSGALQRSGSGKGEILRSNFLLLLDAVMEQDSHLFSEEEQSVFDTYRVGPLLRPIPCLGHRRRQAFWGRKSPLVEPAWRQLRRSRH